VNYLINKCLQISVLFLIIIGLKLLPITYHIQATGIEGDTFTNQMWILNYILDENDTIVVHIGSNGGDANHSIQFSNWLKFNVAKTHGIIESNAYSGGSVIANACDSLEARPGTYLMFHKARYYTPLGTVIVPHLHGYDDWVSLYIKPRLTEVEIKRFEKGEDVYVDANQYIKRVIKDGVITN
jgi:hypothetical protein